MLTTTATNFRTADDAEAFARFILENGATRDVFDIHRHGTAVTVITADDYCAQWAHVLATDPHPLAAWQSGTAVLC